MRIRFFGNILPFVFVGILAPAVDLNAQTSQIGQLSSGRKLQLEIAPGMERSVSFSSSLQNQFISITAWQLGAPIEIQLFDVHGLLLASNLSAAGPFAPETIHWRSPASGVYGVILRCPQRKLLAHTVLQLRQRPIRLEDEGTLRAESLAREAESLARSGSLGGIQTARERLAQALLELSSPSQLDLRIALQYRLSSLFLLTSEFKKALEAAHKVQSLARESSDVNMRQLSLLNMEQALLGLARYDEAASTARRARAITAKPLNAFLAGKLEYALATPFIYKSEYLQALPHLRRSLRQFERAHLSPETVAPLSDIGLCYELLGRLTDAQPYIERALSLAENNDNRFAQRALLETLGDLYIQIGEYAHAVSILGQSVHLSADAGAEYDEAVATNSLAFAHRLIGDPERAISDYRQVERLALQLNNRDLEFSAVEGRAACYRDLGQPERAITTLSTALAIARGRKDVAGEALTLSVLGLAYSDVNRGHDAESVLKQALNFARQQKIRSREGVVLANLCRAYLLDHRPDLAIRSAVQAIPVLRETGQLPEEARVFDSLMRVYDGLHSPSLAILFGKQAVNVIQILRSKLSSLGPNVRRDFIAFNSDLYRKLADLLASAGRLSEAEDVLSLLKRDEYYRFTQRSSTAVESRIALNNKEAEAIARSAAILGRLATIGVERGRLLAKPQLSRSETERLNILERDISIGNEAFEQFLTEAEHSFKSHSATAVKVEELRESQGMMEDLRELPEGTVAIYTMIGEDTFRAILRTPDFQKLYSYSINSSELSKKVLAFRSQLRDPTIDPRPLGYELYKILLGGMADDLRTVHARTLMLSLDGVLRYMPVSALYDGSHYLVESYRTSVMTLASISRLKDRPDNRWRAAGFGITKDSGDAPALPAVTEELSGIIADRPGSGGILDGQIKLDGEFNELNFRETLRSHFQVVHIASHFRFAPGNETDSYLLLGDGKRLSLSQIRNSANLFRGVQLLTLSACNTGVGDGAEVESFGTLAQRQGAKSVVATLWPVADRSTSLLMQRFYRLRADEPERSKLEALRQAQLSLLNGNSKSMPASSQRRGFIVEEEEPPELPNQLRFNENPDKPFAHPYFWAPFFLMGNWL